MSDKFKGSVQAPALLTLSQSGWKEEIFSILMEAAIKESWINVLINSNVIIFFALLCLSTGFSHTIVSTLFIVQLSCLILAAAAVFLLLKRQRSSHQQGSRLHYFIYAYDVFISLGWGLSFLSYFMLAQGHNYSLFIAYLNLASIMTAILSAKLATLLIADRLILFVPSLSYLAWQQPPFWGFAFGALCIGLLVSFFIAYGTHIRFLREAALLVQLRKQQEQILKESSFREKFLRAITHDLRQPLNSIRLYSHHLATSIDHHEEEFKAIGNSIRSSNAILDSVSQLNWVKEHYPDVILKPVLIDDILAPLIIEFKPIAKEKGLSLRYRTSHYQVLTEQLYLERIVRNLLQNSIQYTASGGIVVGLRNRPDRNQVVLQVVDTGCGIDETDWENIFLDYHRLDNALFAHAGHLGLGLPIAAAIAKALGTTISVSSKINQGSCFSLVLAKAESLP